MAEHYPFTLAALPYAYDGLEPYIDARTVEIHHDKHQAGYVEKLNAVLKDCPMLHGLTLEELLTYNGTLPPLIRTGVSRNAGGVYAHELYFDCMTSARKSELPEGALAAALVRSFKTFEAFRAAFTALAVAQFGSGWAWLAHREDGMLVLIATDNQDTPLPVGLQPILVVDVWEHAYYLKYQNRRADYLAAWWNVVDWGFVCENYEEILKNT